MNLLNIRRAELSGIPYLNNALDFALTRINALWSVEHNVDGTHRSTWQTATYSAGHFTASSGTWGVDAADVHLRYEIRGKTMTVAFSVLATDVGDTPTDLRILIPGGYTAAAPTRNCISTVDAGGTPQFGMALVAAGDTKIYLYRDATGTTTWTATSGDDTSVAGQLTFEIL